jgi:hypothetical protein
MPLNGYSLGKDATFTVVLPTGTLTLNGLTAFTSKPIYEDIKSKPLNGVPIFSTIPQGHQGSFKVDRSDYTIDTYFTTFEAAYFAGQNNQPGTILETIQEADGSITQWQYNGVILKLTEAGTFEADKKVEITIEFQASTKVRVA